MKLFTTFGLVQRGHCVGITRRFALLCLSILLIFSGITMKGCLQPTEDIEGISEEEEQSTSAIAEPSPVLFFDDGSAALWGNASVIDLYDWSFSQRDLDPSYDRATATKVLLSGETITVDGPGVVAEGTSLTITSEGSYIVSGMLTNGSIAVELPGDTDKVQVVLDGATIHCEDGAAFIVESADKVFITLAEGSENKLSDGATHAAVEDDDLHDGVIFSHDDLTLNGTGALIIEGAHANGIVSKDDVRITGGTYEIRANGHGIQGKDCVKILDGSFAITSAQGKDGIHASNDEDETLGYLGIGGGKFVIDSDDDGLHAESALLITGGTIDITQSYEGIEGKTVSLAGGKIKIVAEDDGVNAAQGSNLQDDQSLRGLGEFTGELPGEARERQTPDQPPRDEPGWVRSGEANQESNRSRGDFPQGNNNPAMAANEECFIEISDGKLSVMSGADGLDSNGSIIISGGNTIIDSAASNDNSALDADLGASISAGTFVAIGSAGMAQGFGADSAQAQIMVNSSTKTTVGQEITVNDVKGNAVFAVTPQVSQTNIVISLPQLREGETYTLNSGETILGSVEATFQTGSGLGVPREGW